MYLQRDNLSFCRLIKNRLAGSGGGARGGGDLVKLIASARLDCIVYPRGGGGIPRIEKETTASQIRIAPPRRRKNNLFKSSFGNARFQLCLHHNKSECTVCLSCGMFHPWSVPCLAAIICTFVSVCLVLPTAYVRASSPRVAVCCAAKGRGGGGFSSQENPKAIY